MDYFIIVVTTLAGLYFHAWIYLRIKRWVDRDLALSMAGEDPLKRAFMLQQLEHARVLKIKRGDLTNWLKNAAQHYTPDASQ
ncbi:30S ribosomal protein S3 [Pseudomonas fluorescens]|nr:30S ribosomal protein S3 [Pseudomonas fluorescens]OPB12635.1 30S ribosomal protein S3 [Pseudomonas fluorescens]OPB26382.1 30S ribosomal protein S3 [Pseudomonas fluorescens]